jgi:hypothetical protein
MTIQFSDQEFQVGVPYKTPMTILTGAIIPDYGDSMVVDLSSLIFHKKNYTIDYDHDERETIGTAPVSEFNISDAGWKGVGYLLSLRSDDRAAEVIQRGKAGMEWEVSPVLMLEEGIKESIPQGNEIIVNGSLKQGPFNLYKNVPVRGLSFCPYARDKNTNALLGMQRNHFNAGKEVKKMADDKKVKDDILQKFIDRFGTEQGVQLYQDGVDYDEIEKALELLKKAGIEIAAPAEPPPAAPVTETPPVTTPVPETAAEVELKKLNAMIQSLEAKVDKLKMQERGEQYPVSGTKEKTEDSSKSVSFRRQIMNQYNKGTIETKGT